MIGREESAVRQLKQKQIPRFARNDKSLGLSQYYANRNNGKELPMPIENTTTAHPVRYAHELAFSIYLPLLLLWVNDASSRWHNNPGERVPWVLRAELLTSGGYFRQSPADDLKLRVVFVALWVVCAAVLFIFFRGLSRFSFPDIFLRTFAGIVAVAGFPLACVYVCPALYSYRSFPLPLAEALVALVCGFLYVSGGWPSKGPWGFLLLVLHFVFWSWCAWMLHYFSLGGVTLLWPGYSLTWHTREAPQLIYPSLGFLASLAWGLYIRVSD